MIEAVHQFPSAVTSYLTALLGHRWQPAFLQVAEDGQVLAVGGALEPYGLSGINVGAQVSEQLPLLDGMLPLTLGSEPFILPWVNTDAGGYMDVHLIPGEGCDYVICLEAAVDPEERVTMQQIGNEMALHKHRQSQLLESHVGKYVAEQLLTGGFAIREEGERREATLLFCDVRGFTTFAEHHPPQLVFQTLDRLLQAMVQPILDHGGWLDKIAGDAVYTAFGLIPRLPGAVESSPPRLAVQAALAIMRNIQVINDERRQSDLGELGVGIGISTGAVAVGILGTQERRQFAVIGHHVNLAARLQAQALAGEIIVDSPTHLLLGDLAEGFIKRPLRLKGLREDIIAYALGTAPK